ncbi:MAG: hypothetical protein JNL11_03965 [Bdellovibrionaceae bacterium]|nr:hypothetical protein [Pseudobdellovibrionaceae bacterium]
MGIAHSKQFRNSYVSFEIPDRWNCILESTEWVCRSQETNESKEAIIVLTAKERGPSDTLTIYADYMKSPIPAKTKNGGTINSQVMSAPSIKKIKDLDWIDGFHLSSEIPNYYTRYVATIKDNVAVLVTFSAHKEFYTKYTTDFFNAINSLSVFVTKKSLQVPQNYAGNDSLAPIPSAPVSEPIGGLAIDNHANKKSNKLIYIIVSVVCAAIGLLILIRNRKK